jgi:RNA-binding protein YlmH
MEKSVLIAKFAQSDEDKVLFARVLDKMSAAERRGIPAATCFLSEREQVLCGQMLRAAGCIDFHFFGGAPEAERKICAFLPDYLDESWLTEPDSPIAAVRATFRAEDKLTHRDVLGSLMGSGIKRETVGDIYVSTGRCDFLVTREILPYVLQNLVSAGRVHFSVQELPLTELTAPPAQVRDTHASVSTLRLDSVVAAGCKLSRGAAADLIRRGAVALNHLPCEKPDKAVAEGDSFTVRGYGRLRLAAVDGTTRKGRIAVTIQTYL